MCFTDKLEKELMENYSFLQKFLHDFILSKKIINKSLFEIEKKLFLKNQNVKDESHIFISGLPRSGTTSLLNFIYLSNEFGSLKYKNLPFVFAPNFSKLFNKKNIVKKERAHKDGILYDIDSPEAFDEIFFSYNNEFIKNEFLSYIQLILISEKKKRYLSKNNSNYKRINLIRSLLPNAIFLIPIREPFQQSYSLYRQHLLFNQLQNQNDFVRRYMNYLGHNEFGLNHRSWNKPIKFKNFKTVDYWLEQWFLFYKNIYDNINLSDNCFVVVYEELTNTNYIKKLSGCLHLSKLDNLNFNYFRNSNKKINKINYDENNYQKALTLYNKFKEKLLNF